MQRTFIINNKKYYRAGSKELSRGNHYIAWKLDNGGYVYRRMNLSEVIKWKISFLIEKIQYKIFIPKSLTESIKEKINQ